MKTTLFYPVHRLLFSLMKLKHLSIKTFQHQLYLHDFSTLPTWFLIFTYMISQLYLHDFSTLPTWFLNFTYMISHVLLWIYLKYCSLDIKQQLTNQFYLQQNPTWRLLLSGILHQNFWFFNSIYHPTAWQIKNPLKRNNS
jgi:hypothetical protein